MDSDARISKLARNLSRAENEEQFIQPCEQIRDLLESADNRRYVMRSFSCLNVAFEAAFKFLAGAKWSIATTEYAKLLAKIGSSVDVHTIKFFPWIFDLIETGYSEAKNSEVAEIVQHIFLQMIQYLSKKALSFLLTEIHGYMAKEAFETVETFKTLCSAFIKIIRQEIHCDSTKFQEFVDVVIGWMVDEDQFELKVSFCAEVLLKLETYFVYDASFTSHVLGQILDDLDESIKAFESTLCTKRLIRSSLLVKACCTILSVSSQVDKEYLCAVSDRFFSSVINLLSYITASSTGLPSSPGIQKLIIDYTLDYLCHSDSCDKPSSRAFLKLLIENQVQSNPVLNYSRFADISRGFYAWIQAIVHNAQLDQDSSEMLDLLLPVMEQELLMSRSNPLSTISCVQSLMRSRNVIILQKVYSWLVKLIMDNQSPTVIRNRKRVQYSALLSLSDVATGKANSILTRWALDPPIFDLLLTIFAAAEENEFKYAILNVLKAHCLTHSHFVSSVFSQTYSVESSSHNHLVTLTQFWISTLDSDHAHDSDVLLWIADWILVFLKTTLPYAAVLVVNLSDFFFHLLRLMNERSDFQLILSEILVVLVSEPGYSRSRLYPAIRSTSIKIVLDSLCDTARSNALKAVNNLEELVLTTTDNLPTPIDSRTSIIQPESVCIYIEREDIRMSSVSYENFLTDLIDVPHQTSDTDEIHRHYSFQDVKSAVSVLVRNKLKSSLGKPPDLFGALQNLLKKYLSSKHEFRIPIWKIQFLFLLDREIHLAMQTSLVHRCEHAEAVKTFYTTNKVPCTEWLKRLRTDVAEISLSSGYPEYSFLLASSLLDDAKVKVASFCLKDSETLSSLGEEILCDFLRGHFDKIYEEFSTDEETQLCYPVDAAVVQVKTALQELACQALSDWPQDPSTFNLTEFPKKSLFEVRDECYHENKFCELTIANPVVPMALVESVAAKTSILVIGDQKPVLHPLSVLNLCSWVECNSANQASELAADVKMLEMQTLLDYNNSQSVEFKLKEQQIASSPETVGPEITYFDLFCLKAQSDVFFAQKLYDKSAAIHGTMRTLLEEHKDVEHFQAFQTVWAKDYLEKLRISQPFFTAITVNSVLGDQRVLFKTTFEFIEFEYKRLLDAVGENAALMFSYADFLYTLRDSDQFDKLNNLKQESATRYVQYLDLSAKSLKTRKLGMTWQQAKEIPNGQHILTATVRLISLIQQGCNVQLNGTFCSNHWLPFLPGLVLMDNLHEVLFKTFPNESSFLIASHQAIMKDKVQPAIRDRKHVFDPNAYGYQDSQQDAEPVRSSLNYIMEWFSFPSHKEVAHRKAGSMLRLPPEITLVFNELQRMGTSREDQWISAFQKLHFDWQKRISCLKDDAARENSAELFQSYLRPVWTFCEELLLHAQNDCSTPANALFLTNYKASMLKIISQFQNCTSILQALQTYADFGRLLVSFSSSVESKLAVSQLSPLLSKFDFLNSSCKITLPGLPNSVHVVRVEPVAQVLATKTKPKKIGFRGSDGKCYFFLLKGNENLNVDSSVMQLLKLVESVIDWPARSYYVTPLGKKGGLIQLVPNTVPIFYLYKKYLQKNGIDDRTTDMFWQRMNDTGQTDRSNLKALQAVYDQLSEETSPDILSKEIQLAANTPKEWYRGIHTFTRDCAMASAIGYVLGVGDRHLDNILVDISNGYLIHVDFSLVFGKGASLKVPERVPFRLTQNIANALQYPGISGSFKVLLDANIRQMKNFSEAVTFAVQHVAWAFDIPEEFPFFPLSILATELNSAFTILKSRQAKTSRPGAILKVDLLEMTKELIITKSEISGGEKRLELATIAIENYTSTLSHLTCAKSDPVAIEDLRRKMPSQLQKKACTERMKKLEKFLLNQDKDYQEAMTSADIITAEISGSIGTLQLLKESMKEDCSSSSAELVTLFEEAIELADLTVAVAWSLNGMAYKAHIITRLLRCIKEFYKSSNQLPPDMPLTHTPESAARVQYELVQETIRIQDQMMQLQSVVDSLGNSDLSSEINTTAFEISTIDYSIDENLSFFDETDWRILSIASPVLAEAISTINIPYNFVLKIIFRCYPKLGASLKDYGSSILDELTSIHVEARNFLKVMLDGYFTPLKDYGTKIIYSTSATINALKMVVDEPLSCKTYCQEKLQEKWDKTISELEARFTNFEKLILGEDLHAFSLQEDIIAQLLEPVTNFTSPISDETKRLILRAAGKLVSKAVPVESPKESKVLKMLLTKSQAYEERMAHLKGLRMSLSGTEAAFLFFNDLKHRFEFAFYYELKLDEVANGGMYQAFQSLVEMLQQFSLKWLSIDDQNPCLNGRILSQTADIQPVIQRAYEFMSRVYKCSCSVVTFHSCSRNPNLLRQYIQLSDTLKSLGSRKGETKQNDAAYHIAQCCEGPVPDSFPFTKEGNFMWLELMEKHVLKRLQNEVTLKKNLVENLSKCNKRDKLISARISRIANRWSRVLTNLHPILTFIYKYCKSTVSTERFRNVVFKKWLTRVGNFWFLKSEEEQLRDANVLYEEFDFSEQTLCELVEILDTCLPLEINPAVVGYFLSKPSKVADSCIAFSSGKLEEFGEKTGAEAIISEAVNRESLAQMYEGWSAWV